MLAVMLCLVVSIWLVLYIVSKGKYAHLVDSINKKYCPLKQFVSPGFFILDMIGYKYRSKYDRKLFLKLGEIHGIKNSKFYLKVHMANKILFIFIGLALVSFFGICTEPDLTYGFFSICLLSAAVCLTDMELNTMVKKRRILIRMDFPDFINKLTLLINAGMTVSRAWEKASVDNGKEGPLYEELRNTVLEIKGGKPEHSAYEDFAKRCRTPEITRVMSVILQNLRKGGIQMVSVLRLYSNECWDMRKNAAKKLGEEAGTKMLFPLSLMFIAILIIAAAPAILAMRGI